MSMNAHVKSLTKSVNFHLRNMYRIRRYITTESCHHLARSLILSRLDYANSLLLGISAKDRKQLQRLQNRAAKVVYKCNRLEPSAPLLRDLHWLPVAERIIFKVLLLVFKALHDVAPAYLSDHLVLYVPGRDNMRSSNNYLLHVPRTSRSMGDNAFCSAGPRHWNALPGHLRFAPSVNVFKKHLKTHLFPPV
ncbi:uncharacterized protein [Amphiura filiformis]|uniref:uncharacterized protein n=1 Tax=Amphiura filiformis TaxID=82378 RepID=UPI003B228C22